MNLNLPILTDAQIRSLLAHPKALPEGSRDALLKRRKPYPGKTQGVVSVDESLEVGALRGRLLVFARQGTKSEQQFAVGLDYIDLQSNRYPVLRCDGPAPTSHTSRTTGVIVPPGACHVHRLSEAALRHRSAGPDDAAELCDEFSTLPQAVRHLLTLANLSADEMFLDV